MANKTKVPYAWYFLFRTFILSFLKIQVSKLILILIKMILRWIQISRCKSIQINKISNLFFILICKHLKLFKNIFLITVICKTFSNNWTRIINPKPITPCEKTLQRNRFAWIVTNHWIYQCSEISYFFGVGYEWTGLVLRSHFLKDVPHIFYTEFYLLNIV